MEINEPQVFLIARPQFDWAAARRYLEEVNGLEWYWNRYPFYDVTPDGQNLVEFAGRMCYRSWRPGLNKNVTKVREDQGDYLTNILRSGHGSVLEHANFTFVFHNVTRVFTHELVRHRAGVAISQESLRFVRLTDIGFRMPRVLAEPPPGRTPQQHEVFTQGIVSIVESLEEWQREAADYYSLDEDGVPFHVKKEVTSALRRLAPIGLTTDIVWTANLRTIRHVLEARTAPGAEEEIREVFHEVGTIMRDECPDVFGDYAVDEGHWTTEYRKV